MLNWWLPCCNSYVKVFKLILGFVVEANVPYKIRIKCIWQVTIRNLIVFLALQMVLTKPRIKGLDQSCH